MDLSHLLAHLRDELKFANETASTSLARLHSANELIVSQTEQLAALDDEVITLREENRVLRSGLTPNTMTEPMVHGDEAGDTPMSLLDNYPFLSGISPSNPRLTPIPLSDWISPNRNVETRSPLRRVQRTLLERIQIVQLFEGHKGSKEEFARKVGVDAHTIRRWKRKLPDYQAEMENRPHGRRVSVGNNQRMFPKLEHRLMQWMDTQTTEGVDYNTIVEKTDELIAEMTAKGEADDKADSFRGSYGWLSAFRQRYAKHRREVDAGTANDLT